MLQSWRSELKKLESSGQGGSIYALLLRMLLKAPTREERLNLTIRMQEELRRLEEDGRGHTSYAGALRSALGKTQEQKAPGKDLYYYYLEHLEREGRGDEPFARALRSALESEEYPTLDALLAWSQQQEEENGSDATDIAS